MLIFDCLDCMCLPPTPAGSPVANPSVILFILSLKSTPRALQCIQKRRNATRSRREREICKNHDFSRFSDPSRPSPPPIRPIRLGQRSSGWPPMPTPGGPTPPPPVAPDAGGLPAVSLVPRERVAAVWGRLAAPFGRQTKI